MFTRPMTDAVIRGIVNDLNEQIAPDLHAEAAKVALGMIVQILQGCAARAAHEIAWMHDEIADIVVALQGVDDSAVVAALGALDLGPRGLDLADVIARYDLASQALSLGIEGAYERDDAALAERLRVLLEERSAHEMQIVGALALVGRG